MLASEEDVAGINIRDRLLEAAKWEEVATFDGRPVLKTNGLLLASMAKPHLFANDVDKEFMAATGLKIDDIIFLSRHRAASGIPTLTVHPIGNYGKADYGGKEGQLVPLSPALMTALLRQLKIESNGLPFQVSYEVTHHGPWLETPTLFIEIGSDERNWGHKGAAEAIARSLLNAEQDDAPVAIGIGGGHYAPRFTEASLSHRISFGHMVPNHALEDIGVEVITDRITKAMNASKASMAYIHKKSMSGAKAREMRAICEALGLKVVDSASLQPR
ncbi:MAG: D-tyrosyl-tRNA(Tyr) deacylase [Methanomassiliicoccales archaeon PtaU1.Bin124]|nr:MAG: D-tyrosyl-tRNA(Tyr) deacylase [Methanomassiliicoccales archaeon PtaU1.Bin124]